MGHRFLVGGGKLAELGYGGGNDVQSEIDVGGSSVAAEAEAQAGAGFVGGKADGGKDVRRLDGAGGAGGSGGTGEASEVEGNEERFAFDAGKDNVCSVWSARSSAAVHARLGNTLEQALLQFVSQSGDLQGFSFERLARDFGGFAESDDSGDVFRAWTKTALVMSTIEKLAQARAAAHV
jgi:hypothetical protein